MRIKVLGSSGAEFPNYSPPAFLIDDRILLDAGTITGSLGESAQRKISHILITHAHLDHIRGIPTLVDNMFLRKNKHSITLVGIKEVLQTVRKNLFNNTVWPDFTRIPSLKNPFLRLKVIQTGRNFKIHNYKVIAEKVNHSITTVGYIIEDSKGKELLYTGDTGPTKNLWKRVNIKPRKTNFDGAIIEVTFPNRMRDTALKTGHLTPAMFAGELKKFKKPPRKLFITHPKPQFLSTLTKELHSLKIKHLTILKEGKTYII